MRLLVETVDSGLRRDLDEWVRIRSELAIGDPSRRLIAPGPSVERTNTCFTGQTAVDLRHERRALLATDEDEPH